MLSSYYGGYRKRRSHRLGGAILRPHRPIFHTLPLGRGRVRRRRVGGGIFGDIGNVLKNIASSVGTKFVSSKLGLGRRRRHTRMGGRVRFRHPGAAELASYHSGLAGHLHPYLNPIPSLEEQEAAGRRRRRRRTGRGIVSSLLGLAGLGRRRRHRRGRGIPTLI